MPRLDSSDARRAAVLISLLSLGLVQCDRRQPQPPAEAAPAAPAPAPAATPMPALDRSALLAALDAAASAFAAGAAPPSPDPLVGRTFRLRLPFGCGGARAAADHEQPLDGLAYARRAAEGDAIQLSLKPADWTDSALIARTGATASWEAVEGFWIDRPWLRTGACPAVAGDPLQTGAAPASPQTAGLAAVFEAGGSRASRRNGRAYTHTLRGEGGQPPAPASEGYRLRLEGRIAAFPDGRAIRCAARGPDQRPVCIAAAQVDTVAFETASGQTLSEWSGG